MDKLNQVLSFKLLELGSFTLTLSELIAVVIILIGARIAVGLSTRFIRRRLSKSAPDDPGRRQAVTQLVGYFLYVVAGLMMLHAVGFQISYLLAGSAALFVGLGFGLQSTFNDFVSGIIILFAGTIEVGDVVEVEGLVCKVKSIGMRSTQVITRNSITVIIPNAKFTHENVVNWSHSQSHTRFIIKVGVAYGSEVGLVERLLIEAAIDHEQVLKEPQPRARLAEFGTYSLDFELLFWTREPFEVEFTKGDIRKNIVALFARQGVVIPFPQRDVHVVSDFRSLSFAEPRDNNDTETA